MYPTVSELASLVGGRVHGQADRVIRAARPLQEAGPDDISFVENERHLKHLKNCRAAALVVAPAVARRIKESDDSPPFALVEVGEPLGAFVTIYRRLEGELAAPPAGIAPEASIHPTAKVGPGCTILPFAVIGENAEIGARCIIYPGAYVGANCRLGDDVVLHPQTVLYAGCVLGNRVIIHAGSIVGSDGFGYRFAGGKHVKVPHLGRVEIGDDVEIGACTTIDRGTFQATRIGAGSKIDNLVQIAHNCQIGRHNLLCAQVGIAGSCRTGDHVVMGGGAGLADHVSVGDRVAIGARSGVAADVENDQRVTGVPARAERETLRIWATMGHLPEMWRELRLLKQQMEALSPPVSQQERKAG